MADQEINLGQEMDTELIQEFLSDAYEHLSAIEQGILVLEENPSDKEAIDNVFRAFHTFKGNAGFLNLVPIAELAHKLENLLDAVRCGHLSTDSQVVDLILKGGDILGKFVTEISDQLSGKKPVVPFSIETGGLPELLDQILSGDAPANEDTGMCDSPSIAELPEPKTEKMAEPTQPVMTPEVAEVLEAKESFSLAQSSVKVATHKLDSLVDLVGEFVIAQSQVMQSIRAEEFLNEHAVRNLAQLSRISKELQRTAMSLRMVPIRNTFQRMHRLVRDVSSRQGKQVTLILEGEDTEIDRNIVEAIHDPLVHMIRNSVDHGIESVEKRLAAGKDPEGKIVLRAYHQAGNIIIEINDDGAGLNRERILDKAISRNLVDSSADLSDEEVFNLIFTPGFSTAETITDISGRGVGMDVVKRNIHKLRGRIDISSVQGKGSCFEISLPLTLAIIEGLLVRVNSHCYILPVNSVRESFRLRMDQTTTVNGRGRLIRVRESLIPLLDLGEYFHVSADRKKADDRIVIILESENEKRCIVVDELLGKHEVVIKNIGSIFDLDPAISGATILGDGLVGLILEPSVLVHLPSAA